MRITVNIKILRWVPPKEFGILPSQTTTQKHAKRYADNETHPSGTYPNMDHVRTIKEIIPTIKFSTYWCCIENYLTTLCSLEAIAIVKIGLLTQVALCVLPSAFLVPSTTSTSRPSVRRNSVSALVWANKEKKFCYNLQAWTESFWNKAFDSFH